MMPAQLAAWRRRLECALADPRPDRKSIRMLFAEMALALVSCHEREERILVRMPLQALDDRQLRDGARLEEHLPTGRTTLPAEGIGRLLERRRK